MIRRELRYNKNKYVSLIYLRISAVTCTVTNAKAKTVTTAVSIF